jgi:uncharacterized protein YjbI with pentapeptide repeats
MAPPEDMCRSCFSQCLPVSRCPTCGYDRTEAATEGQLIAVGQCLAGRYYIGRNLGQGGFGATYLSWDDRLQAPVAIKEFLPLGCAVRSRDGLFVEPHGPEKDNFPHGLCRFLEEAKSLAKFRSSDRVVSVYDVFETNGTAYIVMEYLPGLSLRQIQKKHFNERLEPKAAVLFLGKVLEGIREIHQYGVLHRDICPENIIVLDDKAVKLVDFGSARHAIRAQIKKISIVIKPGYAPCEQYTGTGQGEWTDIYAVAATFYHLLTGEMPPDAVARLAEDTLRPISDHGVSLPRGVEAAILRGLALRPVDRWQAACAFLEAIAEEGHVFAAQPKLPALRQPEAGTKIEGDGPDLSGWHGHHDQHVPAGKNAVALRPNAILPVRVPAGSGGAASERKVIADVDIDHGVIGTAISFSELKTLLERHGRYLRGLVGGRRLDLTLRNLTGLALPGADLTDAVLTGAVFKNCDLQEVKFQMCDAFCVDFRKASLGGADFSRADLRGARFDEADLTAARLDGADCREGVLFFQDSAGNLINIQEQRAGKSVSFSGALMNKARLMGSDLRDADFTSASLREANFKNANVQNAQFAGARLDAADFDGAVLDNADFTFSDLTKVDTRRAEFSKAKMRRSLHDIDEALRDRIMSHQKWVDSMSREGKRLALKNGDLSGLQLPGVNWSAAELVCIDFTGANLSNARLSMATFTGSNLSEADLTKVDARGANFRHCTLDNANLERGNFGPVTSTNDMDTKWSAQFEGGRLTGAHMGRGVFRNANFALADLTDADIRRADLRGANFTHAILRGADLRGANLQGADIGSADLTGANTDGVDLSSQALA